MATAQSQQYAEWRAIQKERERERRRMRDRQRRQSMSVEEREKHLARRRRNYQLRRQRAANAQSGFQQQVNSSTETVAEPSNRNHSLALVCVYEPRAQSVPDLQFAPSEANHMKNTSAVKDDIEAALPTRKYPRVLRLTQIKHLARLLNSSADKPPVGSQEMEPGAVSGEITAPVCIPRRGIRLVHLKHLIRGLNSKMETTSEQNESDKMMQGESNILVNQIETSDNKVLWDGSAIHATYENQQTPAANKCSL